MNPALATRKLMRCGDPKANGAMLRFMPNLQNKSILVYDESGTFTHVAERLAKDFGQVGYFVQWQSGFSDVAHFLPGLGLPEIEKIADPFTVLDRFDMVLFADVGMGGLQKYLRSIGMPVFGS